MPSAGFIAPLFQNIVAGRTLIMFDQRGVGRSEPALSCPEWVTAQIGLLEGDPSPETTLRRNNEALIACGDTLRPLKRGGLRRAKALTRSAVSRRRDHPKRL